MQRFRLIGKRAGIGILLGGAAYMTALLLHGQLHGRQAFTVRSTEANLEAVPGGGYKPVHQWELIFVSRGDGAIAEGRQVVAPDGVVCSQRAVRDPKSRRKIVVEGCSQSLTTTGLTENDVKGLLHKPAACVTNPNPAESMLLGYRVVQGILEVPAAEAFKVETWYAPDLDCAILKQDTYRKAASGETVLAVTRQAHSVTLGAESAYFEIPDWPERSPSELHVRAMEMYPHLGLRVPPGAAKMDEAYHLSRKQAGIGE